MIASLYCKLAMAWWEDEHGDRTRAVEAMIDAEKAALRVYQLSRYPYMYASRQNNLGMAYRNRVEGDQSANVEQAIASYMAALEIFTPDAYPGDYAMVQLNLGIAYQNRIVGERGTNLEQAINCHQFALPFYGYDSFLLKWAWLQYYLGNAYYYRIEGTRQANLEQAITHFEAALRVIIHEAFPQQWAEMQYYLGLIYSERSAGDPSANQALSRGYIVDASCHGSFNIRAPLDSALQLAKGLRLLILSACQTAILDMRGAMDEAHSLAVGMVQAGAEAVLAALWRVDDKATYLLIARFAQEWLPRMKQEPPAAALARAQYWLRTARIVSYETGRQTLWKQ